MYYPLPTRSKTKSGNRHGLHFRKMLPITKNRLEKYMIFENNTFDKMVQDYIDKHLKDIIIDAQNYLDNYSENKPLIFATNLDILLKLIDD